MGNDNVVLEVEVAGLIDGELTVVRIESTIEAALKIIRAISHNPNKIRSVVRIDDTLDR